MPFDGWWREPEPEPEPHIPHRALIAAVLFVDAALWGLGIWVAIAVSPWLSHALPMLLALATTVCTPFLVCRAAGWLLG